MAVPVLDVLHVVVGHPGVLAMGAGEAEPLHPEFFRISCTFPPCRGMTRRTSADEREGLPLRPAEHVPTMGGALRAFRLGMRGQRR